MTNSRTIRRLFTAAALAFAMLPCSSHAAGETTLPAKCNPPSYPRESEQREEDGISLLGFLVRSNGIVADSTIFSSSGSARLDQAALAALSVCAFKPATENGAPIDNWVEVSYVWTFTDDPDMKRAQRDAALAAAKGDASGFFRLYLLLSHFAKTDADRERALLLLLNAAERGHAHAQYEAGRRYEKGLGLQADAGKAQQWYEKAAAQGDLLALQRLKPGSPQH